MKILFTLFLIFAFSSTSLSAVTCQSLLESREESYEDEQTLKNTAEQMKMLLGDEFLQFKKDLEEGVKDSRYFTKTMLKALNGVSINLGQWKEYNVVMTSEERTALIAIAENSRSEESYNAQIEKLSSLGEFYGLDHAVLFNKKEGLLMDLSYKRFLRGRVEENDLASFSSVFIGSIKDFRILMDSYLSKADIDKLLTSVEVGGAKGSKSFLDLERSN